MFANKVVLITGGSAGIGAATAECFAKEAAILSVVGRNVEKLHNVAKSCKKLGAQVLVIQADVSNDNEVKTIVSKTIEKFGKIDVLVNNAGILKTAGLLDNNTMEVFDEVIKTNLRAVIQMTKIAAPYLKETKGNIINVSSVAGMKIVIPALAAYSISKAGLDQFTKATAIELSSFGVRVNSVNPGPVLTDMIRNPNMLERLDTTNVSERTLLNRTSDPEEIGDLIMYLASDKARGITGSCVLTDNGIFLK